MRILVTGGAGFIGSNLVWALARDYEVGVVDDLSTGDADNVHPDAWFRRLDILDDAFPRAFEEFAPDIVVHLAAQSSVAASLTDPVRDWSVNAEGTRIVAELAASTGATRVISASSAAVYGDPGHAQLPLPETAQKAPLSPYGESKLAAEELLASELAATDVDFASFRFSNVYGPRQDAFGEGGVVAIFCGALARGETPVVYGAGTQTRDFVYVGDVVAALTAVALTDVTLRDGSPGGPAYNISTGTETAVDALASMLGPVSGFTGAFEHVAPREGDIERSALDPSKARDVFAWDARVSLDRGLPLTYRWFSQGK
jgi:UDP-glucose 4-epimerase